MFTPTRVNQLTLTVVVGLIICSTTSYPAIAQEAEPDEIIRVRLDLNGPDNEWIRIERQGNALRLIHTKRSRSGSGIGGVANFLIDTAGPSNLEFSSWDDHQTTRTLFEPDNCSSGSASLSVEAANINQGIPLTTLLVKTPEQFRLPLDSADCAVVGTDTLVLPEGTDIRQGQFTVEYIERDLLRSVTFRIPQDE